MDNLKGKLFVVTGATGRQGSAVVHHLIKHGAKVKAITRSPQSEKAKHLAAPGAEVVAGNMGKPDSLRNLFEGAVDAVRRDRNNMSKCTYERY